MKSIQFLVILCAGFFVSCSSPDYFYKQSSKGQPHATLALRNGTTQVLKIDGKYPPEKATATVRLEPGQHLIEVATQGQRSSYLGFPGYTRPEITAQGLMTADMAPGKTYRPEANIRSSGTYFFLRDEGGIRSAATKAHSAHY